MMWEWQVKREDLPCRLIPVCDKGLYKRHPFLLLVSSALVLLPWTPLLVVASRSRLRSHFVHRWRVCIAWISSRRPRIRRKFQAECILFWWCALEGLWHQLRRISKRSDIQKKRKHTQKVRGAFSGLTLEPQIQEILLCVFRWPKINYSALIVLSTWVTLLLPCLAPQLYRRDYIWTRKLDRKNKL